MRWKAITFDWNQVRAFLATVEEGSLSAAARALGSTQPTLSRQVTGLEETLGVLLFERGPRSMVLTSAGVELVDHVRAMGEAASRISLSASGHSQAVDGTVSISATEMTAAYWIPPRLETLRERAPNIRIEIVSSNLIDDLIRRDADIAIRHGPPEHGDLIGKHVGNSVAQLYGSRHYLDRFGCPATLDELSAHTLIGQTPLQANLPSLRALGLELVEDDFNIIATSSLTLLELVRQGLGLSFVQRHTAKLFPELVPVLADDLSPLIPIWLVTHRELHKSRRIRIVFDWIEESIEGGL